MTNPEKYLVLFYCASAGQNGPELGTDEEEIVLLVYWVFDLHSNQVISRFEYPVKPSSADINENILSEQCRDVYHLTEDDVKSAKSLGEVLHQFDEDIAAQNIEFTLVTDGQLHIRQCLFPEAQRKNLMPLPIYYHKFHDLRKEFTAAHPNSSVASIEDMLTCLDLNSDEVEESPTSGVRDVQNMTRILQKLFCDGFKLHDPDIVQCRLEQGIRTREESVDTNCCVRARGLPWQASDQDIARFFVGLNIAKGGVALCLSNQGRRNGEALVLFENAAHRDMAIKRHKHHIGNRYIEVYKATGEDFIGVAGGNNKEAQMFLSRGAQVIIRMRGLPYNATPKEVIDFFASGDQGCQVLEDESGVLFVRKPDGKATGDAFVLFAEEEDAERALLKHKKEIGSRYIELFRSTTAEVQQVLNRTMEIHAQKQNSYNHHQQQQLQQQQQQQQQQQLSRDMLQLPLISSLPLPLPVHQHQQVITAGTLKDCIRLRGLPFEADVEQILNFLGENGKNIVEQGIHMVVNAQGQPSGEAFIQMRTERDAFLAAQQRHHKYMVHGKKQRYIEVFQCSGDDMNHLLTGAGPGSAAAAVAAANQSAALAAAVASQNKGASTPAGLLPAGHLFSPHHPMPLGAYPYNPSLMHHHPNSAVAAAVAAMGGSFPTSFSAPPPSHHPSLLYWPYPSPPISPNNYYNGLTNGGPPPPLPGLNSGMGNGSIHPSMLTPPHMPMSPQSMAMPENGRCIRGSSIEHINGHHLPLPATPTSTASAATAMRIKENTNLSPALRNSTSVESPTELAKTNSKMADVHEVSEHFVTSAAAATSTTTPSIELFPAV